MTNIKDRIMMNKKPIIIGAVVTVVLSITTGVIVYLTWPEAEVTDTTTPMKPMDKLREAAKDVGKQQAAIRGMGGTAPSPVAKPEEDTVFKNCNYGPTDDARNDLIFVQMTDSAIFSQTYDIAKNTDPNVVEAVYKNVYEPKPLVNFENLLRVPFDLNNDWNTARYPINFTQHGTNNYPQTLGVRFFFIDAQNYSFGTLTLKNITIEPKMNERVAIAMVAKQTCLHMIVYQFNDTEWKSVEYKTDIKPDFTLATPPENDFELVPDENRLDPIFPLMGVKMVEGNNYINMPWPFAVNGVSSDKTDKKLADKEIAEVVKLMDSDLEHITILKTFNFQTNKNGFKGKFNFNTGYKRSKVNRVPGGEYVPLEGEYFEPHLSRDELTQFNKIREEENEAEATS